MSHYLDIEIPSTQPEDVTMQETLDIRNQRTPNRETDQIQHEKTETFKPHDTAPKETPQSNLTTAVTSHYVNGNGSTVLPKPFGSAIGRKITFTTPYASGKKTPVVTPLPKENRKEKESPKSTTSTSKPVSTIVTTNDTNIHDTKQHPSAKDSTPTEDLQIYHSALLDKAFKPKNETLSLSSELEPLRPLILSQHKSFTQPIKDLGHINLTLTKIINNKKESLLKLQKNKIPRSLQLKCELTTSPAYISNLDFLKLKTELQDEVINFIEKGSHIMTKWAEINIHLLTRDRCTDILSKALQILDGVTSFYTEIIGTPIWPSVPTTHINLFLFKLYPSNALIDITDIIDYLNVPSENILLIATKILTNLTTDEEANELISSFNLSDIDLDDEQQLSIIRETLTSFDQILR
jgi:hypothetical protein